MLATTVMVLEDSSDEVVDLLSEEPQAANPAIIVPAAIAATAAFRAFPHFTRIVIVSFYLFLLITIIKIDNVSIHPKLRVVFIIVY